MFRQLFGKKVGAAKGFTLIEILIVIGIIAILAAIVIIAINPAKQFAQARNTQRESGINSVLNAIGQRIADNKGVFAGTVIGGATCPSLPSSETDVYKGTVPGGSTGVDLSCLVPTYLPSFPVDPTGSSGNNTGYTVSVTSVGRVTICAPDSVEVALGSPSQICVTR